jgi:hypothetical protein
MWVTGSASSADSLPVVNSPVRAVAPVLSWPSKTAEPWAACAGAALATVSAAITPATAAAPAKSPRRGVPPAPPAARPLISPAPFTCLATADLLLHTHPGHHRHPGRYAAPEVGQTQPNRARLYVPHREQPLHRNLKRTVPTGAETGLERH